MVLYGPSNSGKTALFHRLKSGEFVSTLSSMKENEGSFVWKTSHPGFEKPQHTVDIPGHGRLHWRLKDFVGVARAIVVVVDSTAIGNVAYCRDAAGMIWDAIYSKLNPGTKIIIACNKSDDLLSVSSKRVRLLLETQLSALSRTRSKYPGYHDDNDAHNAEPDTIASAEEFKFDVSSPVPVDFVVTSVKKGDLKELFDQLCK